MEFYEPTKFRTQSESNRQASNDDELIDPLVTYFYGTMGHSGKASVVIKEHHERAFALYEALLLSKVCREQARGVLPQSMYTEYYGTVNLNNLFKFIDLRMHAGAQWEIQKVAEACLKIISEIYPVTVAAYSK